jgi:hypothetical protein
MNRSLALGLVSLGIAVGCSNSIEPSASGGGGGGEGGSPPGSGTGWNPASSSVVASSSGSGSPAGSSLAATVDKDLTLSGDVDMLKTTTVLAGVTLTLSPGTKLLAAKDAELIVNGKIVVDATAASPVVFQSKEHTGPDGWVGLHIQNGGEASLKHIEIHDAKFAFNASAGSTFGIDHILVDTSTFVAKLEASGTLNHGTLHALGAAQKGSPITVNSASPKVSNTTINNANGTTDHIIVTGASSAPVFDHMDISECHCAFHFNEGKGATISSSLVHDSFYGLMVINSIGTKVTNSNFTKNQINIGLCTGGDVTATGSYFDDPAFDGDCTGQTNTTPVTKPITGIGPQP